MDQPSWPPYSYVPGKFPHPESDSQGHGYQSVAATVLEPETWQSCAAYLAGFELLNRGYYWEAHETWEGVWHLAGRRGTVADYLKGLIKLAAAMVKGREGRAVGVQRHARRAAQLFRLTRQQVDDVIYLGMSLDLLCHVAQAMIDAPESYLNTSDDNVVCILNTRLMPARNGDHA